MSRPIPDSYSLMLDLLRFGAAVVVVAYHTMSPAVTGSQSIFHSYGGDAVMVFFVLSGFVIEMTRTRHPNISDYMSARVARLWSVIIPAIALTYTLDLLSYLINSNYYLEWWAQKPSKLVLCPVIDVMFLNEIWGRDCSIASNGVIWSIGYEATYYFMYGAIAYLPYMIGIPIALFAAVIKGPLVAAYFLIWYLGVLAYKVCMKSKQNIFIGITATFLSIITYVVLNISGREQISGLASPRLRDRFGEAFVHGEQAEWLFVVGVLTFVLLVGLFHLSKSVRLSSVLNNFKQPIRILAGSTFTIYMIHRPILVFLVAALGYPLSNGFGLLWVTLVTAIAVVAGIYIERHKKMWRSLTDAIISSIKPRRPKARLARTEKQLPRSGV